MQKNTQTPGTVLKDFVEKHGLNCNRLAKAVKMSNAMMRLLILDKSPISVNAAFRLAKFFKTEPKFWLELQMNYDIAKVAGDKELAKTLSEIVEVGKYEFTRKSNKLSEPKAKASAAKVQAAKKPAAKRKVAEKKAGPTKPSAKSRP
ncbi:MAG: HigA family addiction module antitoxin [Treponema sp.]|nr:HigA family addiction module antitoxin [Treponema sp.]